MDFEVFKEVVKGLLEEEGFDCVLIDLFVGIELGFCIVVVFVEGVLVVVNFEVLLVCDVDCIIGLFEV